MSESNTNVRLGQVIAGRYRLDTVIGEGGMGSVFGATHVLTERRVAIKLLTVAQSLDQMRFQRFVREARTAVRLKHPNVVDVLDMGEAEAGELYLALELLRGENLQQRLNRTGTLSLLDTFSLLVPIMSAVSVAHAEGMVHRDLKPSNIFLSRADDGQTVPKLLDFGIVKELRSAEDNTTREGVVLGTPHFMAPEQASSSSSIGPPADVWSMGTVLYRCLGGRTPFEGTNHVAVLYAIASGDFPPLGELVSSLPPDLVACIERAMRVNVADRHADMGKFLDELQRIGSTVPALAQLFSGLAPRSQAVRTNPNLTPTPRSPVVSKPIEPHPAPVPRRAAPSANTPSSAALAPTVTAAPTPRSPEFDTQDEPSATKAAQPPGQSVVTLEVRGTPQRKLLLTLLLGGPAGILVFLLTLRLLPDEVPKGHTPAGLSPVQEGVVILPAEAPPVSPSSPSLKNDGAEDRAWKEAVEAKGVTGAAHKQLSLSYRQLLEAEKLASAELEAFKKSLRSQATSAQKEELATLSNRYDRMSQALSPCEALFASRSWRQSEGKLSLAEALMLAKNFAGAAAAYREVTQQIEVFLKTCRTPRLASDRLETEGEAEALRAKIRGWDRTRFNRTASDQALARAQALGEEAQAARLRALDEALSHAPDSVPARFARSVVLAAQGNLQKAEDDLSVALELAAPNPGLHYNRALMRLERKKWESALQDLERAVALDQTKPNFYSTRGAIRRQSVSLPDPEDSERAIELDPNFVEAYTIRGEARHDAKHFAGAIEDYSRVLQIDPTRSEVLLRRARARLESQDFLGAIEDCDALLSEAPDRALAYEVRGRAYFGVRRYREATRDLGRFVELDPDSERRQAAEELIKRAAAPQN